MRKTVIYIGSIFLPDKSAGAQRAIALSKTFRDLGYSVVIIGMKEGQDRKMPILDSKSLCEEFETYSVSRPESILDWTHHTLSINEFVEVVEYYGSENVHSIVAMEYESIALLKLVKYCKKKGISLIADAEEWYEKSRLGFPMNVAKNLDTIIRMRYVYPHKVRNMICISKFFKNHYQKNVPNRTYIPGTIDPSDGKWKGFDKYEPNEIITIGYAGHPGLMFEKERLDLLILAVSDLNNEGIPCKLKIAGVDETFILQRGVLYKNTENIIFYGKINHRACLEMIASCDFSAIIRESKRVTNAGFPTKLSESFGCGTPVIATNSSNIKDYIIENETGLICLEPSKDAIKSTIRKASTIEKETLKRMHSDIPNNSELIYSRFTEDLKAFLENMV